MSGTNIKTVNDNSLLGGGNVDLAKYHDNADGAVPFVASAVINASDQRTEQTPNRPNFMQVFHQARNGTCRAINIGAKSEASGGIANSMEYYEKDTPEGQWLKRWAIDCEDSGWVKLNDVVSYRKKLGFCQLAIRGNVPDAVPGSTYGSLGTLPKGFRPAIELYTEVHVHNFPTVVRVARSGDIGLYGATSGVTANQVVSGSIMFML